MDEPAVRNTAKALIVDEIFDGNLVELQIVAISAAVGVPTTIIGAPWQALYAFRGTRPDMIPHLSVSSRSRLTRSASHSASSRRRCRISRLLFAPVSP